MAHKQQKQFCREIKKRFSYLFKNANVVDVGSLDINGNNRSLWRWYEPKYRRYLGIDIVKGKNVDVVGEAHMILPMIAPEGGRFNPIDIIICTEMLEHDKHWKKSLLAMYKALRPGGLLLITAAGVGRPEHGTREHHPDCSPGTNDYYKNISNEMFDSVLDRSLLFSFTIMRQEKTNCDFQFAGIKRLHPHRLVEDILHRSL